MNELTEREQQVYNLFVSENVSITQAAQKLNLSHRTVGNYLQKIYLKLGIKSLPDMIRQHYRN